MTRHPRVTHSNGKLIATMSRAELAETVLALETENARSFYARVRVTERFPNCTHLTGPTCDPDAMGYCVVCNSKIAPELGNA